MRKRTLTIAAMLVFLAPGAVWAWGFRQHEDINAGAVDILPAPLHDFFELYKDEVKAHAIDPDLWVEAKVLTPGYAHFIDMDALDAPPFAGIPKTWDGAAAKFGEMTLKKSGTLPWEIERRQVELTAAFREKRWDDVVKDAAWIGHFIADSTMPLHTTKDYLGKVAGNIVLEERGPNHSAHQRIEWGLTEYYAEEYERVRGNLADVGHESDVLDVTWKTLRQSYTLIPQVLDADKRAAAADESFGKTFYAELNRLDGPLVKKQMALSEELAASAWLTAWVDAGKPELPAKRGEVSWPATSASVGEHARTPVNYTAAGAALAVVVIAIVLVIVRGRRRR